jgi:hypothetical protein
MRSEGEPCLAQVFLDIMRERKHDERSRLHASRRGVPVDAFPAEFLGGLYDDAEPNP